ncbi:Por secretion system C-terminal sorting domain-containing protein [Flavobacterium fluvii]|uniref:Por secretion system C-terminal sorting domain-containing protein n=1 Tax=Flavobacterium fluvii TaxID=468056 RepID=A0A1M5NEM0_9FLAO|nr:S8 family serine peptidase [Flavobacterium fluvii]SHG87912.1 Por secretion system C-terminal sorting domain-containing protein [Flavobacterium fluvii]
MKKLYLFLFLVSSFVGFSQEDAWVYFKDKPDAATYLANPLTMLSQRALDRRTNQGIPLDSKDVPIYQPYIDQVIASAGITVKAKSKWFNCVHVRGLQANITALTSLYFVEKVEFANRSINVNKISAPKQGKNKPVNKTLQTTTTFNYGNSANQIQMLNGHLLHQSNYTGSGKIIAVMDGGFLGVDTAPTFARLRTNNQILGGYNYVDKSTNFYTGATHGTSVLSLMGGYVDNALVGTAPDASYYLFITEDGASENPVEESNWVEAAEEADRLGVDIITTSLGYTTFDNSNYNLTYTDMNGVTAFISKGVDVAFSRGMVCVVSAGNEGNLAWHYVSAPADALNALTIGAVKADETYATFSSQGPTYDGRVKPDVTAQGQNPYVSDVSGNIINTGSGTSYSGPIVAGMVACLWQALPTKTNQQIKQLIVQSADRYTAPTVQYGYGIPDFSLALVNGNALSVADYSKSDFIVYPNPATDSISVTLSEGFNTGNAVFYTVLGQKVLEEKITKQSSVISIKSLSKGTYLYKIESNGFAKSGKIIKE